jgi:hypothetical protein
LGELVGNLSAFATDFGKWRSIKAMGATAKFFSENQN